ncbi:MAG: response regulator, partial [Acetobacterales bacterium]
MAADSELRPALRIVLVDDDSLFAESLGENLRDAGFAVQSFISGDKCLGFFDDGGNADLLLLDWKMDGTSGIEVLRRLRDEGKDVPAIFLTALTDQMFEEAALATGAVDFVDKARSFS